MPHDSVGELNPPDRMLLGPGPSNLHPRVLHALSTPIVGHLDPAFLTIMDETCGLLRETFKTANQLTIPISGTASAGMEAAICNLVEPGDTVVIGVKGVFGQRMAEVASRYGANVVAVEGEWGLPLEPERFEDAMRSLPRVKVVAVVHGETSTGVLQPLEEIARLAAARDALFLVDAVTSLGGVEVRIDDWGIDIAFSGTQKCLGAPPGLSPLTLGPRAVEALQGRKSKVTSWYLDLSLLQMYWGSERVYHHTAPISMIYALREALRVVHEEGLEARIARHRRNALALWAGLEAMGLELVVPPPHRINSLTTVRIPEGVDDAAVRGALLNEFGVEIGAGLGPFKGKAWRIGLMGYSSRLENIVTLLNALEQLLPRQGFEVARGTGIMAAEKASAAA